MTPQSPILLSIIGTHADEDINKILERKINDIERAYYTFWMYRSFKAKPNQVKENKPMMVYFIEPSKPGGASPTKKSDKANYFSNDRKEWIPMRSNISPVTGNINSSSIALILDKLERCNNRFINLTSYSELGSMNPIRFQLGASTICALINKEFHKEEKMRKVVAIGRVVNCVWLKK